MRSEQFATLVCLLGSLDAIDFNLYIKEQAIPKEPFALDWERFLSPEGIDFGAVDPPLAMPSFVLQQFAHGLPAAAPAAPPTPAELLGTVQRLEEENRQLRRSIISQLNQRSFFEEECTKQGRRLKKLQAQLDALSEAHQAQLAREHALQATLQAHEATNQSLQYQLAHAQPPPRALSSGPAGPQSALSGSRPAWSEHGDAPLAAEARIRALETELKLMTSLKDQYKARLGNP